MSKLTESMKELAEAQEAIKTLKPLLFGEDTIEDKTISDEIKPVVLEVPATERRSARAIISTLMGFATLGAVLVPTSPVERIETRAERDARLRKLDEQEEQERVAREESYRHTEASRHPNHTREQARNLKKLAREQAAALRKKHARRELPDRYVRPTHGSTRRAAPEHADGPGNGFQVLTRRRVELHGLRHVHDSLHRSAGYLDAHVTPLIRARHTLVAVQGSQISLCHPRDEPVDREIS
jgi:hypothetical protein